MHVYDWIVKQFPPGFDKMLYLEPFGGTGLVWWRKARKNPLEIYNDHDGRMTQLMSVLAEPHKRKSFLQMLNDPGFLPSPSVRKAMRFAQWVTMGPSPEKSFLRQLVEVKRSFERSAVESLDPVDFIHKYCSKGSFALVLPPPNYDDHDRLAKALNYWDGEWVLVIPDREDLVEKYWGTPKPLLWKSAGGCSDLGLVLMKG